MINKKIDHFVKLLSECTDENVGPHEGTSSVYNRFFNHIFGADAEVSRVVNSDGVWKLPTNTFGENVYMLTEYKYDRNLKSKLELCKVIAQCAVYLRKIYELWKKSPTDVHIPKLVFIGDKNEMVLIPANQIMQFVGQSIDWNIPASSAYKNTELMQALVSSNVTDFAFTYDLVVGDTDFEGFFHTLKSICSDRKTEPLNVNEHNIERVWKKFKSIMFERSKINTNDQVAIFIKFITSCDECFVDKECTRMVYKDKIIPVPKPEALRRFCDYFNYVRSIKERRTLQSTCDRFIDDMNRRMKGEFYTPTAFVDYTHGMIAKEFGDDWKEKYVVWDCAWGTGNLTRDYHFKELYCSTLEQGELDIAKNNNPEATKFQFDFLNDELDKLPLGLKNALERKKPILFLINPPYATAGSSGKTKSNKEGVKGAKSMILEHMKKEKVSGTNELYAQFLYRIGKIKEKYDIDVKIALICNPKFITGPKFSKFRNYFLSHFDFVSGVIFNAGHFSNVSASWGITINIWQNGNAIDKTMFEHEVLDVNEEGEIVSKGCKTLYYTNKNVGSYFRLKNVVYDCDYPTMNNALSVTNITKRFSDSFFGNIETHGMSVSQFRSFLFFFSGASGSGSPISHENFTEAMNVYAAGKLAEQSWLNEKDEMMIPDVTHYLYQQFSDDAVVFSIFHGLASSMRNVDREGKLWNIKNEFFWMSRDEIKELAEKCDFESLYNDANASDDRYVYKKLQNLNISNEARAVLDKASDIVRKTFIYREELHKDHPEYHLNTWDAGWYQIKKMVNELGMFKNDMNEFKNIFNTLSDKMRPMVYELGFLRR